MELTVTVFLRAVTFAATMCCVLSVSLPSTREGIDHHRLTSAKDTFDVWITMKEGTRQIVAEVSQMRFATAAEKRVALRGALIRNAERSQAELLRDLEELAHVNPSQMTSFWITNQIHVSNAGSTVLKLLEEHDDVERVDVEKAKRSQSKSSKIRHSGQEPPLATTRAGEPGENLISMRVPEVWAKGVNGSGVVVAIVDTGVHASHEALRGTFENGEYSWRDPVHNDRAPYDDHGHGTMSMGLLVGGEGIGVAPGAKWMACKGVDEDGQPGQLWMLACVQWLLCPDNGETGCTQTGRVLSAGFNDPDLTISWLDQFIDLIDELDTIVVASVGDYGERGCKTIGFPAHFTPILAVGAIDSNSGNGRWFKSGQGPTVKNESVKPDVMAPGVNVISSCINLDEVRDTDYCSGTGTGYSAPQVAGVVALLISANPGLSGKQVREIIKNTASRDLGFSGTHCDEKPDSTFPNYQFGHGRVDAFAAYECAVSPALPCLDGFEESSGENGTNRAVLWISLGAAGGAVIIILAATYFICARRRRLEKTAPPLPTNSDVLGTGALAIDSDVLVHETSLDNIIGQFRSGAWPQMVALRELASHYALESGAGSDGEIGNYVALTQPYDFEQYEIAMDALTVDEGHILASGEFGVVFAGLLATTKTAPAATIVQVAVKKLRPGGATDSEAVGAFLKELQIMTFVGKHPNIVQLLGACTRASTAEGMCMVLGLCSNGNLEKYLRSRRGLFVDQRVEASNDSSGRTSQITHTQAETKAAQYVTVSAYTPILTQLSPITTTDLLRWIVGIAAGMEFLAEKKVVHGDLAARNVLLDENLAVKISDFGLASKLYEYTYSSMKKSADGSCRPLPWRWMALEALRNLKFSSASDVWSFGITAWEIFSLSEVPYPGLVFGEPFLCKVEFGYRNVKPKYSTDELFSVISRCWELEPNKRPCMSDLKEVFANALDKQLAIS